MAKLDSDRALFPEQIVVGLDKDGRADGAVHMAVDLASLTHAIVECVHAHPELPARWPGMDPVQSAEFSYSILQRTEAHLSNRLKRMLQPDLDAGASEHGSKTATVARPKTRVQVTEGSPARVILDKLKACRSPWLFVGPHRMPKVRPFGNTLRAVFAKASCPVWVHKRPEISIRRIFVPVDLSAESRRALDTARALAQLYGATVRVVRWFDPTPFEYTYPDGGMPAVFPFEEVRESERIAFQEAMENWPWEGVEHSFEFLDGNPAIEVVQKSREFDLVVLGAHGRTGLASVVLGGVAYSAVKHCESSVLVVRAPNRPFQVD
jgi:nucleotide-binding universal stress UspA family protein